MDSTTAVGLSAWVELLHAEASWTLTKAGLQPLILKGPSISTWLYDQGRDSTDADVLITPAEWEKAVTALKDRGFRDLAIGTRRGEQVEHAQTFTRDDPTQGAHQVDLHRFFPGIDLDATAAFEILWSHRMTVDQAGVRVAVTDRPATTLIIALHAARGALTPKVLEDLRRAWQRGGTPLFNEARDLAADLDALTAFKVGLEHLDEAPRLVVDLGLQEVPVTPMWRLRSQSAPGTAIHLEQALELPWRARPAFLVRWLFPSPATMRLREPQLPPGGGSLATAYARRLITGVRQAPSAISIVRRSRAD